ncbi:ribonuclease H-like domain-containing protein [Tanacetum coccineum]
MLIPTYCKVPDFSNKVIYDMWKSVNAWNEKIQKRNDVKDNSMLLVELPNVRHLFTWFNAVPRMAKILFAALQKQDLVVMIATKKTRKTLLKQMYENLSAPSTESLDYIFNRLQKIVSQVAILGENISQEDLNLKFLRSLSSEWNTYVVFKQGCKEHANSSLSSSSHNMAFVSSPSSTNEVNTAYGVSTDNTQVSPVSTKVSTASTQVSTASLSDATLGIVGADEDKKVFSRKSGQDFARECRGSRSQDNMNRNQDTSRRTVNVEETSSKAMFAIDGASFDWSYLADDEVPTNMALMAFSDSEGTKDAKNCSKNLSKKSFEILISLDNLRIEFNKSEFNLATYKRGLASVEERFVFYKKNEEIVLNGPIGGEELVSNDKLEKKTVFPTKINFVRPQQQEKPARKPANYNYHQKERVASGSNYTMVNYNYFAKKAHPGVHMNMAPRAVLMKSGLRPLNTARPVNIAHPKTTVYSARPMPNTTVVNAVRANQTSRNLMEDMLPLGEELNEVELLVKELLELMCDKKNSVLFIDSGCFVLSFDFKLADESQVLLKVPRKNNMYSVDMKNIVPKESLTCLVAKATLDESMLWHRRLGHINFKIINKLVKDNLVRGLPTKCFENDQTCVACLKGKQHKASCKSKIQNSISQPLFMLHMDLFGPTFVSSLMNKKYCLVVTDDYSRFTWVFFLASKDETSDILKSFITQIENLVDKKVKIIRCDNGTEFKNRVMSETLIEAARTMLANSKLPTTCWAEAVNTTCYVQNRVLVIKPHNKTPYELFRGRTPALSFMIPFGCHVTILNTLDHLGKFYGKSNDGFFVGYSLNSDGPKWLFDIDTLTKSMNCVLVVAGTNSNDFVGTKESIDAGQSSNETGSSQDYILMPLWKDGSLFDSSSKNASNDEPQPSNDAGKKDDESGIDDQERPKNSVQDVNTAGPNINTASINTGSLNINTASLTVITAPLEATHVDFFGDETEVDMSNITNIYPVSSTLNTRIHKDHSLEHVIGNVQSGVQTRRMTNEQGFISVVYEGKTHEDLHTCLFACFLSQVEPKKVLQALQDPSWIEAMQEELLQFKLQQVWTLVDLPYSKRAIGTKWVYRNKKDERGIVIRNKSRLVAQGYTQEEGIDYDEVFAPVAMIEAIRLFLAYASFKDFVVYQMDVKSAFLYGKIEEEVYVYQPLGFKDPESPDKVYNVEKALYGLHQDPRAWYETLSTYLLDNGFQRGQIDKTLFIKRVKGDILLVQVYVDDIIFGSTRKEMCTDFKKMMHKKFQMSSMGELTFFLGLQVTQKNDGIFISQDKYVDEILKKFGFSTVKTASTPMETSKPLLKDAKVKDVDVHLYRSMIGSLMYHTASRPDIMFVVCACARFQVTPKGSHLHAVKRIFRYLKGQPKLGLWYPKDSPFDLEAYTDSDYAGASLDRKSITGGCQFLRSRLISWQCKKQTIFVISTTKAEYVAATSCYGQVLWIENQMLDYGYNFMNTKIFIDNESTIFIVKNPVFHSKTKHIEIRHHFIRDSNEKKLI